MKVNWLASALLLLFAITHRSPAQQNEADRKLLADIRAKAEKGDARYQFELGITLFHGNLGMAKNYQEAVKWYHKAADQNFAAAQDVLGFCYSIGQGVAKDEVEGVKWLRRAAGQNY